MRAMTLALGAVLILAGCTSVSYKGLVRPVSPGVGAPGFADTVDSLTPTFRWKAEAKAPCADAPPTPCVYDFAIWEKGASTGSTVEWGPTLYKREGLTRPEHTVDVPLGPDAMYFWSVRIRTGDQVSAWGTYDYRTFAGVTTVTGRNWRYPFRTPKAAAAK